MSAAENRPPNNAAKSDDKPLSSPPKRPSLRKPPARPESPPPAASATPGPTEVVASRPAQETVSESASKATETAATAETTTTAPKTCNHPIAPPSEPMQYRAIGLVRGVYQPSEEQLNRGNIVTDDGVTIDSVLLGRITSLIKKHIDLESSHLWVVYPRTRQPLEETDDAAASGGLHLQIVGIWEPDTLGLPGENPKTKAQAESADEADITEATTDAEPAASTVDPEPASAPTEEPSENYFSIRGEVLNYDDASETILVKIVQGSKRSNKPPKAFKLNLFGKISGKTAGYFWEFDVERRDERLVVTEGRPIRMVPPKKKKGKSFGPRRGKRPINGSDRPKPARGSDKPRVRPPAPVKSNPL